MSGWAGESVVRSLTAFAEDPAPTRNLTSVCSSSSRGLDALFWPPQALHTFGVQTQENRVPRQENKTKQNLSNN